MTASEPTNILEYNDQLICYFGRVHRGRLSQLIGIQTLEQGAHDDVKQTLLELRLERKNILPNIVKMMMTMMMMMTTIMMMPMTMTTATFSPAYVT
jgi:hypothetical protein